MDEAEASQSLAALELRLHRLEYLLNGGADLPLETSLSNDQKPHARLTRLERGLNDLASQSSTIRQLIQLRELQKQPSRWA